VGIALTTREELVLFKVLNIRKCGSQTEKEMRFRGEVERLLDRYPVGAVALVDAPKSEGPIVDAMDRWLSGALLARGLPSTRWRDHALRERAAVSPVKQRPTNRHLAIHLAERFPELHGCLPEKWGRMPAGQERYWRPMFLALAGALAHLEDHALQRALCHQEETQTQTSA